MEIYHLDSMIRGWFIGNFEPSIFKTNDVEVAIKKYNRGDYEHSHYHKIATEITAIVSGNVSMNGKQYKKGDIIVITPGESTDFKCMEDGTISVVVKIPGANNDKYINK